jgi:5-methylcytosine-specific restriction endonuclease McrA
MARSPSYIEVVEQLVTLRCAWCGDVVQRRRPNQTHCSTRCQSNAATARNPRKPSSGTARPTREVRSCAACSRPFGAHRDRTTYCSRECQMAGRRAKRSRPGATCRRCRGALVGGSTAHCGACMVGTALAVCVTCSTAWQRPFGSSRRHCSETCSRRSRARSLARRARAARRRAAARGVPVQLVKLDAIWERDAGLCQLCWTPVDRGARVPEPTSATLDHRVPLARGGAHQPGNLQLAHFICNSRKRDLVAA